MRRILSLLTLLWLLAVGTAGAQISIPYSNFQPGTTILAEEANANNSALAAQALNRTGGTMTGPLVATSISASSAFTGTSLTLTGALTGTTGNFSGGLAAAGLTSSGNVLPGSSNVYDLGSSGFRWDDLFIRNIDISGGVVTSLLPGTTTTFDLGSTSKRWKGFYGQTLDLTGALTGTSATFTGTVTGSLFSGSGASLTAIPETAIVDGILLARVAAAETITSPWTFNGGTTNTTLTLVNTDNTGPSINFVNTAQSWFAGIRGTGGGEFAIANNTMGSFPLQISAADAITLSGSVTAAGAFSTPGTISPSILVSGNTNNYNPAGLSDAYLVRIQPASGGSTLTGIMAPASGGRQLAVCIVTAAGNSLTFADEDVASSAANRFTGASVTLGGMKPGCALLLYDSSAARWHVIAINMGA
jgi:hypothetical protein